ncbi:MAG TPA: hypothetical protein PKO06_23905 [Candidatus Ozemobacteraceae bacterium]|nr:hypothetical protein [Candidatus Ozemobacteraceae bacterium]
MRRQQRPATPEEQRRGCLVMVVFIGAAIILNGVMLALPITLPEWVWQVVFFLMVTFGIWLFAA